MSIVLNNRAQEIKKTTLWHKLEKQNKLKRKVEERKVKEGGDGEGEGEERSAVLF